MKRTQTVEEMYYPQVSYIPNDCFYSRCASHLPAEWHLGNNLLEKSSTTSETASGNVEQEARDCVEGGRNRETPSLLLACHEDGTAYHHEHDDIFFNDGSPILTLRLREMLAPSSLLRASRVATCSLICLSHSSSAICQQQKRRLASGWSLFCVCFRS